MSRHWNRRSDMIRYYQTEGFTVGEAACCHCHFKWVATLFPETVSWKLDCPACHWVAPGVTQSNNHFTEFALVK